MTWREQHEIQRLYRFVREQDLVRQEARAGIVRWAGWCVLCLVLAVVAFWVLERDPLAMPFLFAVLVPGLFPGLVMSVDTSVAAAKRAGDALLRIDHLTRTPQVPAMQRDVRP